MASRASNFFANRVAHALFHKGEEIVLWPGGVAAQARTLRAIVRRPTREPYLTGSAANEFETMKIAISARDDDEGIIDPQDQNRAGTPERFVIDGVTWTLQRVAARNDGGWHRLELQDGGNS